VHHDDDDLRGGRQLELQLVEHHVAGVRLEWPHGESRAVVLAVDAVDAMMVAFE
jgi:hypothetical protein